MTLTLTSKFNYSEFKTIAWHTETTNDDNIYGKYYTIKLPHLFDKSLRTLNKISKTRHTIYTGYDFPIKLLHADIFLTNS